MKISKSLLKIDLTVQIILLVTLFVCAFICFLGVGDGMYLIMYFGTEFFLGIWQLLSALTIAAIWNDKWRWQYLAWVLCFFGSLCLFVGILSIISIPPQLNIIYYIGYGILGIVPAIIAIWYTYHTYFDLAKIRNRPRSFWDLT